MPEDLTEKDSLPAAASRFRRARQSRWPLVFVLLLLAAIVVGSVVSLVRSRTGREPWRVDYPGVTWIRGYDANTAEGKRYLQAEVRFEQEIVSAHDVKLFLAALVEHSKGTYEYYHIKVLNGKNVHVLDAVADSSGRHSISITKHYQDQ